MGGQKRPLSPRERGRLGGRASALARDTEAAAARAQEGFLRKCYRLALADCLGRGEDPSLVDLHRRAIQLRKLHLARIRLGLPGVVRAD